MIHNRLMAFYGLIAVGLLVACQFNEKDYVEEDMDSAVVLQLNPVGQQRFSKPILPMEGVPYQNGDIIFHSSQTHQSRAIQLATNSPYSHVGIMHEENGEWYVYEAISTVQSTPLKKWIARGKNKHYVIKRLKDKRLLTEENLMKMKEVGGKYRGKAYDMQFDWSDDQLYCSEVVWKIYDQAIGVELGELQQIKTLNIDHTLVQQKIKERYKSILPLEQWVISPARMFNCKKLETVMVYPEES
ncbi:MAG: YiiX family permuted papain-like enzyme [Aureispira sp.]